MCHSAQLHDSLLISLSKNVTNLNKNNSLCFTSDVNSFCKFSISYMKRTFIHILPLTLCLFSVRLFGIFVASSNPFHHLPVNTSMQTRHICFLVGGGVLVHMSVKARGLLWVSFLRYYLLWFFFFETIFLLDPDLPNRLGFLATVGAPVIHLSLPPKPWDSYVDGLSGLLPFPVNSVSMNTADVSPTYADQRIFLSFGYRPGSESVLGQRVAPFLTF